MPSIGVNLRVTGHCSQGGRKYMEDFFSVAYQQSLSDERDLEYAFIGIYDGHGGSEAATFAKEHLINLIVNQKLFWSNDDRDVLRAIREGYIATHYAMWREQEKWPKTATGLPSTAGTTASVAFIRHGKIYIGHVGDSGIVLGYQEDGEKIWRARPLTQDHKPECNVEQARIVNSGGKVIIKSGVPRVVWNRPRLGHKGPVRRSTPIDEIPFLAVARSLGDLWSYNSALNEFVVSPDPDVRVVKIDPKRFRCLIFGTDGLWNVVTGQAAVENVRLSEQMNERNVCLGGTKEWTNPSKNLVDKALERWSTRKMRADNTSVVIIMLDPPGPPKRDVLKTCPTQPYSLDYLTGSDNAVDEHTEHLEVEPVENFTMFDHSTNEHIDLDGVPMPTNGLAIMTRYENTPDRDFITEKHHQAYMNAIESENSNTDVPYMNSFAESYNSLLNSSLENDHSYIFNNDVGNDDDGAGDEDEFDEDSCDGSKSSHFNASCSTASVDTYSLTKLQTRREQQFNMYSPSSSSSPSTSHSMFENFQHNLIDHNYLGQHNHHAARHYDSMASDYGCSKIAATGSKSSGLDANKLVHLESKAESKSRVDVLHLNTSEFFSNQNASINPNDITIIRNCSKNASQSATKNVNRDSLMPDMKHTATNAVDGAKANTLNTSKENHFEDSIQINEISSSDSDQLTATTQNASKTVPTAKKLLNRPKKQNNNNIQLQIPTAATVIERKVTRSSFASTPSVRITRSADRKTINTKRSLRVTIKAIIQTQTHARLRNGRTHKENISIVRKMQETLANGAIVNPIRTRNSTNVTSHKKNTSLGQRMLRSQNAFTKDTSKSMSNRSASSSQNHHTNVDGKTAITSPPIGTVSSKATNTFTMTRSHVTTSISNKSSNNKFSSSGASSSSVACKTQPKRLLHERVQIVKSDNNNSNKHRKSNHNNNETYVSPHSQVTRQLRDSKLTSVHSFVATSVTQNQTNKKPSLSSSASPTLRCKVLLAKKSIMVQRCNQFLADVSRTMITRRTRLQN